MIQAAPYPADDDAVRRRTFAQCNAIDLAGRRLEVAQHTRPLARIPDATGMGRRRHVVRMLAARRGKVADILATSRRPYKKKGKPNRQNAHVAHLPFAARHVTTPFAAVVSFAR